MKAFFKLSFDIVKILFESYENFECVQLSDDMIFVPSYIWSHVQSIKRNFLNWDNLSIFVRGFYLLDIRGKASLNETKLGANSVFS